MAYPAFMEALLKAQAEAKTQAGGVPGQRLPYTPPRMLPIPQLASSAKRIFPEPPFARGLGTQLGGGASALPTGMPQTQLSGTRLGATQINPLAAAKTHFNPTQMAKTAIGAGAGAETATGLGGLLRGLAGRGAGLAFGLPGMMAGMAATPRGMGDGTVLGSDEGRQIDADIDSAQEELEADRIGYNDPIAMSHAPEFSGVGGAGASGFDGVGPDGAALIAGLMRKQVDSTGNLYVDRDSMRPPMSYPEPDLAGPQVPAGPVGPKVRGASPALAGPGAAPLSAPTPTPGMMNALAESLKNGRPEDAPDAADPMPREQLAMPEPQFQPDSGSETPGMEALLAGLKKKRDPMGGPILTGGGRSMRLGGGNQFLLR